MAEEAPASVVPAELPDVKVEATDVKVEAADVKVEVASTNVPADAATDAGDQSAAPFDAALQQVPAAVQTNVVAGAAAQGAFEDSMPDTAPTSVTSSTNVTSAAQPAATMPTVSDTGRSAATTAPAPVATQLAAHLSNFRGRADGSYETTLTLHPADLGKVSIRIEVLNGTVAIHAMGAQAATVDALRDAMPQLQQELSDAGLNLIGSQVSQQSGQGDQSAERTPAQESAPRISSTLSTSDRSSEVDSSASSGILGRDGRVDVRV
jgi:flagellar hook-length control protein FliK